MGMVGKNSGAKKPCSVPVAAFVIKFYNFGQGRVLKSFRLGRRVIILGVKQGYSPFETHQMNAHLECIALLKEF